MFCDLAVATKNAPAYFAIGSAVGYITSWRRK